MKLKQVIFNNKYRLFLLLTIICLPSPAIHITSNFIWGYIALPFFLISLTLVIALLPLIVINLINHKRWISLSLLIAFIFFIDNRVIFLSKITHDYWEVISIGIAVILIAIILILTVNLISKELLHFKKYLFWVTLFLFSLIVNLVLYPPVLRYIESNKMRKNMIKIAANYAKEYNDTCICRSGKTITEMKIIAPSGDGNEKAFSTPLNLFKIYGKPDTIVQENIIEPVTSYIYFCNNRFIAFHYCYRNNGNDLKYSGCTSGSNINGNYKIKLSRKLAGYFY